jgi:sporulation protein YunB
MIRNSILYRRCWYIKKRNQVNIHILSRLISVIIIFALLLTYVQKLTIPYLSELSQSKARETFISTVNSAIRDSLAGNYFDNNLISTGIDENGNIKSLQVNSVKVKEFSNVLTDLLIKKLYETNLRESSIRFGVLTGINFLSTLGPLIHIKYSPYHNTETVVKSNIINEKANQSSHVISIEIKSQIRINLPLTEKKYKITLEIPISETIIVQ